MEPQSVASADPQTAEQAKFDLFEGFSTEQVGLLQSKFTDKTVKAGEVFIRSGDPGDCFYLIKSGEVEVRTPQPVAGEGEVKVLAKLGNSHVVGEMALLNREPRNADVVALTDCVLGRLAATDFDLVCAQVPALRTVLTRLVAHRLSWSGNDVLARRIGPYTVIAPLGKGGMAWVYRAVRETAAGVRHVVALKMLPHALVMRAGFLERFRQEAQVMTGLRHDNIVSLFETIEIYGTIFLVLEYVPGMNLREWIDFNGRPSVSDVRRIACAVVQALRAAHARGVIHRDVKPDNVMMRQDGAIKLMDFGIAVPVNGPAVSVENIAVTPAYGAPEIFSGARGDPASDFYSLGVMLYELLAGRLPFQVSGFDEAARHHNMTPPPPLRQFCPNLPVDMETLVNAALVKNPAARWAAVAQLLGRFSWHSMSTQLIPPPAQLIHSINSAAPTVVTKVESAAPAAVAPPPQSTILALWLSVPGQSKKSVLLMTRPLIIGRDETADISIDDEWLSRHHAVLTATPQGVHVRDLNSRNGTALNGQQISEADLRQGDRLQLGLVTLIFERVSPTGVHFVVESSSSSSSSSPSPSPAA